MGVPFEQIPNTIRVPFMYVEVRPGAKAPTTGKPKLLIVGQRLASGSVLAHVPTLITSGAQAAAFFGQGSHVHRMALKVFGNYPLAEVWVIAVNDNGAGVAATGVLDWGGAATEAGTLSLYIAGQRVEIAIADGANSAAQATKVQAAIALNADLPVTAVVNGLDNSKVDLTARHAGLLGNDIDLRLNFKGPLAGEAPPAGVTLVVTAMSGGTTAPALTSAITAMADDPYEWILCPYMDTTSLDAWETEMARRWSATVMLYGHVFTAFSGTVAEVSAAIGGATRNDPHVTAWCYPGPAISAGGADPRPAGTPIGSPTPPWEWAAAHTAPVAQSVAIHPSRPFQTLGALGVDAPPMLDRWKVSEMDIVLHDGGALSYYNDAGRVFVSRCITTYQEDAFAQEDDSFLDYNTLAQLSYVNRFVKAKIQSAFARHILVSSGTKVGAGLAVASPNDIRAEIIAAYMELENFAVVENMLGFVANLIVERDTDGNPAGDPNRVNILWPGDLANQLLVVGLLNLFQLQAAAPRA